MHLRRDDFFNRQSETLDLKYAPRPFIESRVNQGLTHRYTSDRLHMQSALASSYSF